MKPTLFSISLLFCSLLPFLSFSQDTDESHQYFLSELSKAQDEISELKKENQQLKIAPALAYQQQVDFLASRRRRDMRRMDSLRYELESAKRVIITLNRMEKVEKERLSNIEHREQELILREARLKKQVQLLKSRESDLARNNDKAEETGVLLEKLREQEKRLKLLEQQLRMSATAENTVGK